MVFARDLSDPLASLAKKLDAATVKNSSAHMGSFIVFLNDDEKLDKKLKDLADKDHLTKIALATMANEAGPDPKSYKIAKDADVTVVLYHKNKCEATYAFKKGEMTKKDVDRIVSDLSKILPEKE
jgi:hypothetical protein